MTHINKLVMKGFKSFARETIILFDRHMNVVVGPNGSGKSNITDALCFVLGRLSIKSIRAAKASNLIFSGNKQFKKANEAYVEIFFDNTDKTFALEEKEIAIRRSVRKNGQSVYKINKQTKTRQEVIELLSQAGIDPHGFNIVLQGEIEKFVKMHSEERRKVIEEVAGISIYEMRKAKSLKELDRANEKLRQINAVLRERTNYLRNLENEREQALRFQKLQLTVKKCKASIINKNIQEKKKELNDNSKEVELRKKETKKREDQITKTTNEITLLNNKIDDISKTIQKSSGLEQDSLNSEITELKQEIAGMTAKKENFENQLIELDRRKQNLQEEAQQGEKEIQEMTKEKGKNKKQELTEKQERLEELDEAKRQSYLLKSNLSSINNQIDDKKRQVQRIKNESKFILDQIQGIEDQIKIKESFEQHQQALVQLKDSLEKDKQKAQKLETGLNEKEKTSAIQQKLIQEAEKIKLQVDKLDICPLCKTKMTKEHIKEVIDKSTNDIKQAEELIRQAEEQVQKIQKQLKETKQLISRQALEINQRNIDMIKLQTINDKKQQLKRNDSQIKAYEKELSNIELKKRSIEKKFSMIKISEEKYEGLKLEVNELQRTEERNLGMEITAKQRELDRTKLAIKQNIRDKGQNIEDLEEINASIEEKQELADEKEGQAEQLKKKYQKMFEQKNNFQDKVRELESKMMKQQDGKRILESSTHNLMITKAQINAKIDGFNQELEEFKGVEFFNLPLEKLRERLANAENTLSRIGSVNLRALEVYDGVKQEYDKVREKVEQLEKEKEEILKIIEQIDRKKKKTFINTLNQVNQLFSNNFSHLSTKGIVTLDVQNKKEPFEAGLSIIVKVGAGKYFDITSLSGGEQTLVALSLIFAIQEFRPYCFYIFDEIDAALDRRNSEKLAYLLKKHMKKGQYLIITHNDSIISESSNLLYGVSMQEGISKVLSIEI